MKLDQYADVQEVADRLDIHPESVGRLIRWGKLPAVKFMNKWVVDKGVLEQFANGYSGIKGRKNKATLF